MSETDTEWVTAVDVFDDWYKRNVELAVARKTRCALCAGQLRPFKSALIGPGVWKCDRCGDEQIVQMGN